VRSAPDLTRAQYPLPENVARFAALDAEQGTAA
jgi:hypothetical protein